MPGISGYPSQHKEDRSDLEFSTVSPTGFLKHALDVRDLSSVQNIASDLTEAGTTAKIITATSHVAQKGDRLRFTSGTHATKEIDVIAVDTNTITLGQELDTAPGIGDGFDILRPISQTLTSSGGFSSVVTFLRDGSNQNVIEDTGTPANNRPLPVKLTDFSGDMVLNAANLNLEVQLSHLGANHDAVRVGDGTDLLAISGSGEASTADSTVRTNTGTIAGAVSGTEMQVDIVDPGTLMLDATGAAIGSDTSSIDGKTPSLGAAVIAASVPVNIASDQTVPVSAASLPLPAGAATEATLSTLNTKFTSGTDIGDVTINNAAGASAVNMQDGGNSITVDDGGGSVTVDNSDLASLGGTVSGSEQQVDIVASLPAGANNIGDVDIASALPAGSNTIGSVDLNRLDVIDFLDTPLVDATTINGSAGAFVEVIASTAAATEKVQVMDTSGAFMGVYTGPAASEVLAFIYGPGSDNTVEVAIAAATRISLRSLEAAAPTAGDISMNFMG